MPEQRGDECVSARLRQHALAGVDQNHRNVAARSTRRHVARVLLVPGRVGDDELAFRRREVAVRDVDRDALLAFGLQSVGEQCEIEFAVVAGLLRAHRFELILVDHLRIVQQPADQRALAVVDAAAREETQNLLAFVLLEIGEDVVRDEVGLVRHSEVPFALLLFHRRGAVVVDQTTLAFGVLRQQHFLDDLGQRRRGRLDGAG